MSTKKVWWYQNRRKTISVSQYDGQVRLHIRGCLGIIASLTKTKNCQCWHCLLMTSSVKHIIVLLSCPTLARKIKQNIEENNIQKAFTETILSLKWHVLVGAVSVVGRTEWAVTGSQGVRLERPLHRKLHDVVLGRIYRERVWSALWFGKD